MNVFIYTDNIMIEIIIKASMWIMRETDGAIFVNMENGSTIKVWVLFYPPPPQASKSYIMYSRVL